MMMMSVHHQHQLLRRTLLLSMLCMLYVGVSGYDDFHYPTEEPSQQADALKTIPELVTVAPTGASCVLAQLGKEENATIGEIVFAKWRVAGIVSQTNDVFVVVEQEFARWTLMAILEMGAKKNAPRILRKSVGMLSEIIQPYFNFTAEDPDYFTKIGNSSSDYATMIAAKQTKYNEPDYTSIASTLAPQRDYAEISNPNDVVKFVVSFNGRVKCSAHNLSEFVDLHSPPPNLQKIVFDPPDHLTYWPTKFENSKTGLVGGHLRIANVGAFSKTVGSGYDIVVFGPIDNPVMMNNGSAPHDDPPCKYSDAIPDTYIRGCPSGGCKDYATLEAAEDACTLVSDCSGITKRATHYEIRQEPQTSPSPYNETSWLLTNADQCRPRPRLPNINYKPGVLVRLREQNTTVGYGEWRYFYADNTTVTALPDGGMFYKNLKEYTEHYDRLFAEGMSVKLPDSDRRQVDMAKSAIQSSMSNFIGHQPNYGDGGTYWSVASKDNGSLPLNIITVGDAMLGWGLCTPALTNIGFYFDNYVDSNGSIIYYTWGNGQADSVADTGRLIDLYLESVRLCQNTTWNQQYLHVAVNLGSKLSEWWDEANKTASTAPAEAKGMLQGAPEHDWAGTTNLYFWNNNVWTARGMDMLGSYLISQNTNITFGKTLLNKATLLRTAIEASIQACIVRDAAGQLVFLPPYAKLNATPYNSMTESREASYSNFRFLSEPILADYLSRDVENLWLHLHNNLGGRVGGASRFQHWLDDMPTDGWGYGALTNNRTDDFLSLLYGHMATYQSRGSFHSTEQLQWIGEGLYRDFLHWPNPSVSTHDLDESERLLQDVPYNVYEADVSFCIVSQSLVARMTIWQLVFYDVYREDTKGVLWLARGAPRRWFDEAFSVTNAPTAYGRISFDYERSGTSGIYTVNPPGCCNKIVWAVRWPNNSTTPLCHGCEILEWDAWNGIALLESNGATAFSAISTVP